ncbi:hypothetical protein [Latilactobacillus graminis]|uniref:Uncharacterized protein n=1 Tax=Latilactobacillus graminis TaxID=60519 RepID=A0ABX6C7Q7_9LACO|nr:hypothetical protein [Latilactobacillus graminis]QFP79431.1 hypothetical protein LG542_03955 [Latilactobacillus graminis]
MEKKEIEKLFDGKVATYDQNHVVIDWQDSRKTLELSIDNDILNLLVSHRDYIRNILKHLKRQTNHTMTKETITINRRNYKIFI